MSGLIANGVKSRGLLSISAFRALIFYSTSASEAVRSDCRTDFVVDYLVSSLGFSREAAVSASVKATPFKSTKKADSVVNFFRGIGFDEAQIRKIVSSVPKLLSTNPEKTLKPKLDFLRDLGLSGCDLAKVLSGNRSILQRSLRSHIIPTIDYLKEVVGSEEDVVKAIRRSNWLLSCGNAPRLMQANVVLLRKSGFSTETIRRMILMYPRCFILKPGWLEEGLHRAEELGIPRGSPVFCYGVYTVLCNSKSTIEKKVKVFKSFGWTDTDVITMARKLPRCLNLTKGKIQSRLKYYMKGVGFSAEYLASRPALLAYSMEKRVVPRREVLRILGEKKLLKVDVALYSVMCLSEEKFVSKFLLPYKDKLPSLCTIYRKRTEQ